VLSKFGIYDIWMRASRSDSPYHIASIFGISIDDWDILAPHSGLFHARDRIQSIMWWCNLKLEVELNDFKT
jgi:hypothetical protein